LTLWCKTIKT